MNVISMSKVLADLSFRVGMHLQAAGCSLACAESCSGGWVAQVVTQTAGSSAWFERGFVTYSNVAKIEMLGVSPTTLQRFGAVSEPTAIEMAQGALRYSHADVALAITGIAGPTGGTPQKPVGSVCFAWATRKNSAVRCHSEVFVGNREHIRYLAVVHALEGVLTMMEKV